MAKYDEVRNRGDGNRDFVPAEASPLEVISTKLLGGFRAFVIDYFWIQTNAALREKDYYQVKTYAVLLTKLEPHYETVWSHLANILATDSSRGADERLGQWALVSSGLDLIEEGIRRLPRSSELYSSIGYTIWQRGQLHPEEMLRRYAEPRETVGWLLPEEFGDREGIRKLIEEIDGMSDPERVLWNSARATSLNARRDEIEESLGLHKAAALGFLSDLRDLGEKSPELRLRVVQSLRTYFPLVADAWIAEYQKSQDETLMQAYRLRSSFDLQHGLARELIIEHADSNFERIESEWLSDISEAQSAADAEVKFAVLSKIRSTLRYLFIIAATSLDKAIEGSTTKLHHFTWAQLFWREAQILTPAENPFVMRCAGRIEDLQKAAEEFEKNQ
ncbi:MAG: hypothetical protein NUW37_12835 [Planctomycetes bacterium]|nr:hypothetical protein [Planctomycetota bacterium]